jgi:hypothetical protein
VEMMMMATSLQMEPNCRAQMNHVESRLQTTMPMV